MNRKIIIAVIGASESTKKQDQIAEEAGKLIAENNMVLICGGLGGVMESAARGAKANNGQTIGILPSREKTTANPYIDIAIPTGLAEARNLILINSADFVISIGGGYGTLSEIAFALKNNVPVIGIGTWQASTGDVKAEIKSVNSPKEAIQVIIASLNRKNA